MPTEPTAPQPRLAYLHGLGRQAHRLGTTAAGAVEHAAKHTTLSGPADRIAVMAGWRMESDAAMGGV